MKTLSLNSGVFAANPKLVKMIIVHCSATPRGRDFSAADIRRCHLQRGFRDIGYHFVIRLDGAIETGRDLGQPGAHCLGKNNCSIGICYVGGVETDGRTPADTRTDAQKAALERLIAELLKLFPDAEIRGHRDFAAKACPSFDATAEYRSLNRRRVSGLCGVVVGAGTALASCRSHRQESKTTAESDTSSVAGSTAIFKSDSAGLTADSVYVCIDRPRVFVSTPDSTLVIFKAEKITRHRGGITVVTKADDAYRSDTLSRSEHRTETVQTQKQPVASASGVTTGIVLGLGAAVVLALAVRYFRSKSNR